MGVGVNKLPPPLRGEGQFVNAYAHGPHLETSLARRSSITYGPGCSGIRSHILLGLWLLIVTIFVMVHTHCFWTSATMQPTISNKFGCDFHAQTLPPQGQGPGHMIEVRPGTGPVNSRGEAASPWVSAHGSPRQGTIIHVYKLSQPEPWPRRALSVRV